MMVSLLLVSKEAFLVNWRNFFHTVLLVQGKSLLLVCNCTEIGNNGRCCNSNCANKLHTSGCCSPFVTLPLTTGTTQGAVIISVCSFDITIATMQPLCNILFEIKLNVVQILPSCYKYSVDYISAVKNA